MNYHSNEWINEQMRAHYNEALEYFSENQIVGLFYQGSGNYGLDTENSDVDTKLIVVPSFRDIALNHKPVSTTHVRENNEHIDFKDVRLYMETFRKQNLNFLEILFTPYYIINPMYEFQWKRLVEKREEIARMNPWRAVKSMKGVAIEKYHAMEHEYPSKVEIIQKYGYDAKQLHHLLRVEEYLARYISGESYMDCLTPRDQEYLVMVKQNLFNLSDARAMANIAMENVVRMSDKFCSETQDHEDENVRALLEDVQYEIMKIAVEKELRK